MTPLYAELHRWAAVPFVWGETDCCLCLAEWVKRLRGVDLGAGLRLTYDDAPSCERVTRWFTDPVGFMAGRMALIDATRTDTPVAGDVAVVMVPGHRHAVGGLCIGNGWAIKGQDGVTTIKPALVRVLAAWSMGYAA